MNKRWILKSLMVLHIVLLLLSCGGLSREYPEIRLYSLDSNRASSPADSNSDAVLFVRGFSASPSCADAKFLLRREGSRVEKDYYNMFVVPPAELLQDQTASWLRASGLFSDVRSSAVLGGADWSLTGHVLALEGDFSTTPPEAVLEMQYVLSPSASRAGSSHFATYRERVELSKPTPAGIVEGWNQGMERILTKLEADISAHISRQTAEGGKQ